MFKRWLAYISIVGLTVSIAVSCTRKINPEESCGFVQNSELQRVSWGRETPIRLYVHQSVPSQYYSAITRAINQWNEQAHKELLKIEAWGVTGHNNPVRDGYSIIYWMNTWDADKPNEQARTTIYWTGNQIYEADMRLNAKNFQFYGLEATTPTIVGVDLESLVVHELGHVLGLGHVATIGSVMVPSLANGVDRREPGATDIQSLKCEY